MATLRVGGRSMKPVVRWHVARLKREVAAWPPVAEGVDDQGGSLSVDEDESLGDDPGRAETWSPTKRERINQR